MPSEHLREALERLRERRAPYDQRTDFDTGYRMALADVEREALAASSSTPARQWRVVGRSRRDGHVVVWGRPRGSMEEVRALAEEFANEEIDDERPLLTYGVQERIASAWVDVPVEREREPTCRCGHITRGVCVICGDRLLPAEGDEG